MHLNIQIIQKNYLKFIVLAEKFYGSQFVVLNVHNLMHIPDDVRNMQCGLSSISAFPFETYLGQLKTIIRSPHNILVQLARRLHEINLYLSHSCSLPSIKILKGN